MDLIFFMFDIVVFDQVLGRRLDKVHGTREVREFSVAR